MCFCRATFCFFYISKFYSAWDIKNFVFKFFLRKHLIILLIFPKAESVLKLNSYWVKELKKLQVVSQKIFWKPLVPILKGLSHQFGAD
jgi:hypothetical protein